LDPAQVPYLNNSYIRSAQTIDFSVNGSKKRPLIFKWCNLTTPFFLLLSLSTFGQKGEFFGGVNVSPGLHPNSLSEMTENPSFGTGLVAQYQFSDKLGLMIVPNFRYFAAIQATDYCTYLCASKRQYSSLETNVGLTLHVVQNAMASSKIYFQFGYSFHQVLRVETEYHFPDDYTVAEWTHEILGHAPFIALDFRHRLGEKYGLSWGLQYAHPISLKNYTDFPLQNPALLVNIRFGRVFKRV